ncbi:aspartate/glutamate racemase family protein [Occultella gossypii]|uniref:Amino acid racemase n=1 Tax=Occultella gossypii TaxID=2800820 RepID=A0ABS7S931_9MICO|nr:amino acid racemase [Occultella gossypii]MBZ2196730.1 amino acid racemase [Occultella gossypii]
MNATVGVLGGMGPMATVEAFRRITMATPADIDQDHLHVIVDSDPSVPDRTRALLEGGEDPRPYLLRSADRLVGAGAEVICMPCNTAHAYYDWLQARVPVPIVNMITETVRIASSSGRSNFGLLATAGTCATNVYGSAFADAGLRLLQPQVDEQARVSRGIARIKAGDLDVLDDFSRIADRLLSQGAVALVLGCTEISLVADELALRYPIIDALGVLVAATIARATGPTSMAVINGPEGASDVA